MRHPHFPRPRAVVTTDAGSRRRILRALKCRSQTTAAPAAGFREEPSADMSGSRSSTGDRSLWKNIGGPMPRRKARPRPTRRTGGPDRGCPSARHRPGKGGEALAAGKRESAAGPHRTGLFDQIVQRAVVRSGTIKARSRSTSKRIFWGNLRMQILTENQQVSVRITDRVSGVRDMIEAASSSSVRAAEPGLHVDRLEVSVSDDPHKQPGAKQARREFETRRRGRVFSADGGPRKTAWSRFYYRARPIARQPSTCLHDALIRGRPQGGSLRKRRIKGWQPWT